MKASIISNPNAGNRDLQTHIRQAGEQLKRHGWAITWRQTEYPGHATELARQSAAQGDDAAIAAGGDGSINEVVNGLVGTPTALGVLPAGTGNVFAAELRLPLPGPLPHQNLLRAANALARAVPRRVDVGRVTFSDATSRYFLLWAGVGLDAAVSQAVAQDKRKRPTMRSLGLAAWMVAAFFVLKEFRGTRMWITTDGTVINRRMIMATVNNAQLYGRFWRLSPEAKIDDGLLDAVVMEGYGWRSSLKHIAQVMFGRHAHDPAVHFFRTRTIDIKTKEAMPVHVDAEAVGTTPIKIDIMPQALTILLPPQAPRHLFSEQKSDTQSE